MSKFFFSYFTNIILLLIGQYFSASKAFNGNNHGLYIYIISNINVVSKIHSQICIYINRTENFHGYITFFIRKSLEGRDKSKEGEHKLSEEFFGTLQRKIKLTNRHSDQREEYFTCRLSKIFPGLNHYSTGFGLREAALHA